jgi:hypothetical protein
MPAKKKSASEPIEMTLRRFQRGDVAVLQSRIMLTKDQMTTLHHQFKKLLPEVKVVILNATARVVEQVDDDSLD